MKTFGDQVRIIKKESLWNEIQKLEREVGSILKNDPDSSEHDVDVKAYRMVIADKKKEYENL